VRELVSDCLLPDATVAKVHMGVFSSFLGRRLQTCPGCYLENKILCGFHPSYQWLGVESRCLDQINVVRLGVRDWEGVGLDKAYRPVANDIVVTCKGSVMHRFTWNGTGCGLAWTREAEDAVLAACQRVSDAIAEIC
jgi:hypothetical protein